MLVFKAMLTTVIEKTQWSQRTTCSAVCCKSLLQEALLQASQCLKFGYLTRRNQHYVGASPGQDGGMGVGWREKSELGRGKSNYIRLCTLPRLWQISIECVVFNTMLGAAPEHRLPTA